MSMQPYFAKATKGARGFTQHQSSFARLRARFMPAARLERGFGAGFTLIETLIAVLVLSLSVAGPLYVADRALVAAQVSRDELTASYLAQEGVEYVRGMRDHEFLYVRQNAPGPNLSRDAWLAFAFGSGGDGQGSIANCVGHSCSLDPAKSMGFGSDHALNLCNNGACPGLFLGANGRYNLTGGVPTGFARSIQATQVSLNNLRVVVTVSWQNHGVTYQATAADNLTPWQ